MCECFGNADVQIEDRPPRYFGEAPTRRISFVRDIGRSDYYEDAYSRPRSSTTSMRQVVGRGGGGYRPSQSGPRGSARQLIYRPAKEYRRDRSEEDRGRDWRKTQQYQAPPKIDYPGSNNNNTTTSRFVPLPPKIHERERDRDDMRGGGDNIIQEPRKGILRNGKKKYSSQRSMVVYSPKRGRRDRRYYYEDDTDSDDESSDADSWDGRSERSEFTEMTEASSDSWAMRPVRKYSTTKPVKRYTAGRSRSRGREYERWD